MGRPKLPIVDRFNKLWIEDKNSGCHVWIGKRSGIGYGRFYINGRMIAAHRVNYELNVQKIPEGLLALHKCDNPPCVNPDHIFLGTHKDNAEDRDSKKRGRNQFGEHKKSHCMRGHKLDEKTTLFRKDGTRACRACHLVSQNEYHRRKKLLNRC